MKKVLLTVILAGAAIFAAEARGVTINLPGFHLNIGKGGPKFGTYVHPPVYKRHYRRPALPPPRRHGHHRPHGKHHRR